MKCDVIDQRVAFEPTDCIHLCSEWLACPGESLMNLFPTLLDFLCHSPFLTLPPTLDLSPGPRILWASSLLPLNWDQRERFGLHTHTHRCSFRCKRWSAFLVAGLSESRSFSLLLLSLAKPQKYDKRTDFFHIYHSCWPARLKPSVCRKKWTSL